jgi:fused signal recognition particle receptor
MFNFFRRKKAADETAAPAAAPVVAHAPAPAVSTWRERLRGNALGRAVSALFSGNPRLDDALLEELETALLGADVGVAATAAVIDDLRRRIQAREFADAGELLTALRADLVRMLQPVARPLEIDATLRPFVLMVVGVNGVGKTTTIGKLAQHLQREGAQVMLAAGDTFRAAAVEQLKAWGQRNGVAVIAQGAGADSASVIFDGLQAAKARDADILIADTAGRLHTQAGLMDELGKIRRVLGKLDPSAPHEVLQVIDGTTGQNAISQVRQFLKVAGVTGLAVTKLDGSARGGVVFALAREFGLPIRYVGVGESLDDLRVFDPQAFVDGLLPERIGD